MHGHACRVHARCPVSGRAFHSTFLGARLPCPGPQKEELQNVVGPQKPSLLGEWIWGRAGVPILSLGKSPGFVGLGGVGAVSDKGYQASALGACSYIPTLKCLGC